MKKMICAFLAMVMLISFTACGGEPSMPAMGHSNGGTMVEPTIQPATPETTMQPDKEEPASPDEEQLSDDPGSDSMEGLLAVGTLLNGAYLIRDEKIYSLNSSVNSNIANFHYGYVSLIGGSILYWGQAGQMMISFGDVPIPVLQESDKIVMYSDEGDVPTLGLRQVEFVGYTIPITVNNLYYYIYDLSIRTSDAMEGLKRRNINNFSVSDSEGTLIDDWRSGLEYGAEYTVSWFQGTQYNERTLVADSRYYENANDERITLEGTLTRDGYVEFNLSELPAGLYALPDYWLSDSGLLEIR